MTGLRQADANLQVDRAAYLTAMTDWLACAAAGAGQRAAQALRGSGDDLLADVAFAGAAGHVLDFDDTYAPGLAHCSAACAPAALVLAAHRGQSLGRALEAYAHGFEAMAALAAASHPDLYDRGWHPTSVCGSIGAAVAAVHLLECSSAQREDALAIALLRAGGTRGAFGSDGKAIQVGLAAAAGVQAALLARAGARVDPRSIHGPLGFERVLGASWPAELGARAIEDNWIKLHPSCLGTHASIDAAQAARADGYEPTGGSLELRVHPVSRQAAHLDSVADGLSAKFSIPYCVAFTLLHGPPGPDDFAGLDAAATSVARRVSVVVDQSLPDFGAILAADGRQLAMIACPRGAPARPVSAAELAAKVSDLAGERLTGALADHDAPAAGVLEAAGLLILPRVP
jgi:2-methylcitrate dehydratase PrpD